MLKKLKFNYKELCMAIVGIFLYSLSIKLFILPNNLYNGGVMGLSQLLRTFIVSTFNVTTTFDISTIIYYLINIPLFVIAYRKIGKIFFYRTILCVSLNTLFLSILPSVNKPLVDDTLTNVVIGGALCGFGTGIAFAVGASTGGIDIIGMMIAKKNRKMSVGIINLIFNIIVYGICGIMNGVATMIYSILYSVFDSSILDKMHLKNICSTALIFSKENPKNIIKYIKNTLDRDATYWEAVGGFDNSKTYITYTALSKYEKLQLESALNDMNEKTFVVMDDGVSVRGEFKKKL